MKCFCLGIKLGKLGCGYLVSIHGHNRDGDGVVGMEVIAPNPGVANLFGVRAK
jgi:hypothetical protein